MKQAKVKGHLLAEKELKEVKGGASYDVFVTTPFPKAFYCMECSYEIYLFSYDAKTGNL